MKNEWLEGERSLQEMVTPMRGVDIVSIVNFNIWFPARKWHY